MEALLAEVERNLELASSTKTMIERERDMLQGEVEERVVLHRFHTGAWESRVNDGTIEQLEEADTLSRCYMHLQEMNEVIDWFNRHGNRIAYLPVMARSVEGYGRKQMIDVLREKCDEAEMLLREARQALEGVDL